MAEPDVSKDECVRQAAFCDQCAAASEDDADIWRALAARWRELAKAASD